MSADHLEVRGGNALQLDLATLDRELVTEMTVVRLQDEHGKVLTPVVPLDMGIVAADVFDIYDEDEAYEAVKRAAGMMPLVTFEWHEDEAPSWVNSLELLVIGDRTYICVSPDPAVAQHWEVIAMCEPGTPKVLEAFFLDLSADNGDAYSVDLYSALPTRVNSAYLSCDTIAAGFAAYLNWDERRSPGAWLHAARYLPRAVGSSPDLVVGSMALRKDENEFSRKRYINAYTAAVYTTETASAVGA